VEHRDLPESEGKTVSDEAGRFRVDGLRPGPHVILPCAKDLEGIHLGPFEADAVLSEATGEITLRHLPAMKVEVIVEAEGYLEVSVPLDLNGGRPPLAVVLLRGGLLEGSVVDADGKPVTGLDLHVFDPTRKHEDWPSTDIEGRVRVRLPAGEYAVDVFRAKEKLVTVETTLEEEKKAELRIALPGD